jgi:hypothetical protein
VVKFLIDECLSLDLVAVACNRGFVESSHVVWVGTAGWKDWELKPFILAGDWTFVTNSVMEVDLNKNGAVELRRRSIPDSD